MFTRRQDVGKVNSEVANLRLRIDQLSSSILQQMNYVFLHVYSTSDFISQLFFVITLLTNIDVIIRN